MLSEAALAYLSTCTYRADAAPRSSYIPLTGIFWDDELPVLEILFKMPEDDQHQILRLFAPRAQLWKGVALSEEEQSFWNAVHSLLPGWAFFQRLTVSPYELECQAAAEQLADDFVQVFSDAEDVSIGEKDGNKQAPPEKERPWWRRIF